MASPTATPNTTSSTAPDAVRLLTPPGAAGIAVVELRGKVHRFAAKHLKSAHPDRHATDLFPGQPAHRLLVDGVDVVDDPLVLLRDERTLELHLHGGPWIVRRAKELANSLGFLPQTFETATVEDWLPFMTTELGVRLLLERGVPLDATLRRMAFPARVALIGPPNVGKSTLANRLLGRDRFITADQPGTTRDWVEELADIGGVPMILTDTPGRRETEDTIEARAIQTSRAAITSADLVVAVHDPDTTEPWPRCDLRVLNKADQPHTESEVLAVSARTGTGIDDLVATLQRLLGVEL